jgi:hypothetical protein
VIVPSSAFQLAAVLLLLVPGIVYSATRRWLGGPTPEDQAFSVRLTRALAVSVVVDLAYVAIGGAALLRVAFGVQAGSAQARIPADPRVAAVLGLVLLVLVPGALAALGHMRVQRPPGWVGQEDATGDREPGWWAKVTALVAEKSPVRLKPLYHPQPTAWDHAARDRGSCFVRIRTEDGDWVGGYLGTASYVSTYPQPRDIFIVAEWMLNEDGGFVRPIKDSLGVYVPLTGKERVAWLQVPNDVQHPNDVDVTDEVD